MVRSARMITLTLCMACSAGYGYADEFDALRTRQESVEQRASTALVLAESLQQQLTAALDAIDALEARVAKIEPLPPTPSPYDMIADETLSLAEAVKASKEGYVVGVKGSHSPFEPSQIKPGTTIVGIENAVIVGRPQDWQAVRLQGDNCRDITLRNLDVDARNCRKQRGVTAIKITVDQDRKPAKRIVLENVNILGVADAIEGAKNHSVGMQCDLGADVTWTGGNIQNVGSYGVYANSVSRLKNLTIKSPGYGIHFYHEGGSSIEGSIASSCDCWETGGIIAWRNSGRIENCKTKLITVGGTALKWTVTKNTVQQIKAQPGTLTILSTTEGVPDDNVYQ